MIKVRPVKTIDDYLRLPEGTRAELIERELYISPSPKLRHQKVVESLYRVLDAFSRERRARGKVSSRAHCARRN